jgi:hypothetical protein
MNAIKAQFTPDPGSWTSSINFKTISSISCFKNIVNYTTSARQRQLNQNPCDQVLLDNNSVKNGHWYCNNHICNNGRTERQCRHIIREMIYWTELWGDNESSWESCTLWELADSFCGRGTGTICEPKKRVRIWKSLPEDWWRHSWVTRFIAYHSEL